MTQDYPTGEEWARRLRERLSWLIDDGYQVSKTRTEDYACFMRFTGDAGEVSVGIYPPMSQIEIFITPKGQQRAQMQVLLRAHHLPAPSSRIATIPPERVDTAFDIHLDALKSLRDTELGGHPLPQDAVETQASTWEERWAPIQSLVDQARADRELLGRQEARPVHESDADDRQSP